MFWHRHLGLLLLAGTGPILLLAFPWLMSNWPPLGVGIALFFSQICHQIPARSFALAGTTLPVCARCLALYSGGFVGVLVYPVLRFRWCRFQAITPLLIVSVGLIAIDVGLDMAGLWDNTFFSRSLTGAFFGGVCGLLLSFAIQHDSPDCSPEQQASERQTGIHSSK
jgi:uncharacterized membrane protein